MTNPAIGESVPFDATQLLECVVYGERTEVSESCIECIDLCQRPENPCIVEIRYKICAPGKYAFVDDLTLFSLDTTDGKNGTWHIMQAIETDPKHSGNKIISNGDFVGTFVFDACDHVSSFFTEPKICVRLTVELLPEDIAAPGGGPTVGAGCVPFGPNGSGLYCNAGDSVLPGLRIPHD